MLDYHRGCAARHPPKNRQPASRVDRGSSCNIPTAGPTSVGVVFIRWPRPVGVRPRVQESIPAYPGRPRTLDPRSEENAGGRI